MKTPLRLFLALALVAAILPFALRADLRGRIECVLLLALLAAIFGLVLPRVGFDRWTAGERAIVLLLLAGIGFGQLVGDARWTFPFVRWEMYGERPDLTAPPAAYALRAVVGGVERDVSLREVFGERGFRVEAALRSRADRPELVEAALATIARLLEEEIGERVEGLRRVPLATPSRAGEEPR